MLKQTRFLLSALFLSVLLIGCKEPDRVITGYVSADLVYLSSAEGGFVQSLFCHEGQAVKQGQTLLQLTTDLSQPALYAAYAARDAAEAATKILTDGTIIDQRRQAEAQMKRCFVRYQYAYNHYQRLRTLVAKQALSEDALVLAESEATAWLMRYRSAKATLQALSPHSRRYQVQVKKKQMAIKRWQVVQAKWRVNQSKVITSQAGHVLSLYYHPGEYVPPHQPVAELLIPEYQYITFFLSAKQLANIHLGQSLPAHLIGQPEVPVTIDYIAKQAEYTPPVIYSQEQTARLVFEVRAHLPKQALAAFHIGQPVMLRLPK